MLLGSSLGSVLQVSDAFLFCACAFCCCYVRVFFFYSEEIDTSSFDLEPQYLSPVGMVPMVIFDHVLGRAPTKGGSSKLKPKAEKM